MTELEGDAQLPAFDMVAVLLFYPDGKRSSSESLMGAPGAEMGGAAMHAPGGVAAPLLVLPPPAPMGGQGAHMIGGGDAIDADGQGAGRHGINEAAAAPQDAAPQAAGNQQAAAAAAAAAVALGMQRQQRQRDATNEYAALFVALIGEGPNPQGVVNTSEGKVVRAFHRFTLVDQTGQGRDLTKGRTRDAGAVKISCARQDPNARNCHGYRKFVKRSILEDPTKGYLMNDTIVIQYSIELVVSSGGALSRGTGTNPSRVDLIRVPPSTLGADLAAMLGEQAGVDVTFVVEDEEMKAHKFILEARSPVFRALLNADMREAREGRVDVHGVRAPVFGALLHYVYTDTLPEGMDVNSLEVEMAQHLLMAADQYQLDRLRRICEKRLCETVDVESVGLTLTLAEQNHAEELKKVCLDYASKHLAAVMATEGYRHLTDSCPQLQGELLATLATLGALPGGGAADARSNHYAAHGQARGGTQRMRGEHEADDTRRVRPRRD